MAEEDPELAELRKRRLAQIQNEQLVQQQAEEQQRQIESQRQAILKGILTDEARERLANIKLAKPDYAITLENQLIQLAQTRRVSDKISDDQLRQLLQQLTKTKRESKITFKRR
ncbi:MAG: DNA-binding protein [Candidatus Heimdallarchaeota archaeon]|nr:MAG: DNA-binding protein [Candidatus Heimdallarchaeota archaeon]